MFKRIAKFVGTRFLDDLAVFFTEFDDILGGFRERADASFKLLRQANVGFILVSSPEPLSVDEALFFHERLVGSAMPFAAFIVNKVHADLPIAAAGPHVLSERAAALPTIEALGLPHDELEQAIEALADAHAGMAALYELARAGDQAPPPITALSATSLLRRVFPRDQLLARIATVRASEELDRDELLDTLARAGYVRSPVVEDPGSFAVRGGVVDLFPPMYRYPIRIELFGDDIETMGLLGVDRLVVAVSGTNTTGWVLPGGSSDAELVVEAGDIDTATARLVAWTPGAQVAPTAPVPAEGTGDPGTDPDAAQPWWVYAAIGGAVAAGVLAIVLSDVSSSRQRIELTIDPP